MFLAAPHNRFCSGCSALPATRSSRHPRRLWSGCLAPQDGSGGPADHAISVRTQSAKSAEVRKSAIIGRRRPTAPTIKPQVKSGFHRSSHTVVHPGSVLGQRPGRVFVARRGRSKLTTTILAPGELADLVERMLGTSGGQSTCRRRLSTRRCPTGRGCTWSSPCPLGQQTPLHGPTGGAEAFGADDSG
jgi:hypothetical protein